MSAIYDSNTKELHFGGITLKGNIYDPSRNIVTFVEIVEKEPTTDSYSSNKKEFKKIYHELYLSSGELRMAGGLVMDAKIV